VEDFQVITQEEGEWTLLVVSGDVDIRTAPELRRAIIECVASGKNNLALVLSGVGFMDSTGLAAMVGGVKRSKENQGQLVLVSPNEQIRRILALTDLTKIFPVHDSVKELPRIDRRASGGPGNVGGVFGAKKVEVT